MLNGAPSLLNFRCGEFGRPMTQASGEAFLEEDDDAMVEEGEDSNDHDLNATDIESGDDSDDNRTLSSINETISIKTRSRVTDLYIYFYRITAAVYAPQPQPTSSWPMSILPFLYPREMFGNEFSILTYVHCISSLSPPLPNFAETSWKPAHSSVLKPQ